MYFNNEKLEIINEHLNKLLIKKLLYVGRGLDIIEAFTAYVSSDYRNHEEKHNKLVNAIWKKGTEHIKDVFSGKDFGALKLLLGDEYAEIFKNIWDRSTLYTYPTGYLRRSYRTNQSSNVYLNKNIEKLKETVYLSATGFTLDKYFTGSKSNYADIEVIADMIALELDNNNKTVLEKLKEIVYSDNNAAVLTREIIKGILMSKNEESHKMIGELLLAAKLQEGLRQSIVESMDEGSREGFIYMLKLIIDNNLSRFSSIVRAFGTWTGLALEVEKPKVINKCLEAAYNCLLDKSYREQCIDSNDNLLIYTGIWSVAFDEVEDIGLVINKLMWAKEKYKKLVALQFMLDTQFSTFSHEIVCSMPREEDFEVVALAIKNMFTDLDVYSLRHNIDALKPYYKLKDHCHGIKLFNQLKAVVDYIPKKEIEFRGSVFPWVNFKLTTAEVLEKMICSVALFYNDEIVDTLLEYKDKMNAETRQVFVELCLKQPNNSKQKKVLIEACGDRSAFVREAAFKIVSEIGLTNDDYRLVENLLQYKSGDLRKSAIKLLLKQPAKDLSDSVQHLISSGNENKRLAAIDIVNAMEGSDTFNKVYEKCLQAVASLSDATQKESLQSKNTSGEVKEIKTFENGFGIYDKAKEGQLPPIEKSKSFDINKRFSMTANELKDILNKFSSLIHENRALEYETTDWNDTKRTVTLGGEYFLQGFIRDNHTLDNYPIADKVRELAKSLRLESARLVELNFYLGSIDSLIYNAYSSWYKGLLESILNFKIVKEFIKSKDKIPYYNFITAYIDLLTKEISKQEKFEYGKDVAEFLYTAIPIDKHYEEYTSKNDQHIYYYSNSIDYIAGSSEVEYWLNLMRECSTDNESFSRYFTTAYSYYKASKYNIHATLSLKHFGRALESGLIDDNEAFLELMARPLSPHNLSMITNEKSYEYKNLIKCPRLMELSKKAVDIIANIEVKRGELNTEVTHLAAEIEKCYGTDIFTAIILGSEKDTYIRGYNFVNGDCTKKQMLSHLLKCCYPKTGENAETLEENLKGKKVTSKQLIEAAMYSPQWLDIVAEYLGYEGLKSACWYFHAHVNDFFSEEKTSIVARYTPISAQDLKDGAFDQKWFAEAYKTLGDKNFKLVYDSAKYIAGGGLHKRSQLFADATLGKLNIEEIKNRVMDKRNKDYLLTYGLIPLKDKEDLLERYEYIHQYIKESKQFGAQRQASEKRSAEIALLNLARNAGYSDVNRLSWNMETAKLDSIKVYLEAEKIDGMEVQLIIDELGQADILYTKEGKKLKDVPAKLKKHEYILELKALKKSLKEQYSRARQSFEASMENGDEFTAEELINLCSNPVLSPIIKNLVFMSKHNHGYLNNGSLIDYNGNEYKLKAEDTVIIAHPVSLYEAGCWSNYQKDIFSKKLVQPFKQVFRELYLPNVDELKAQTLSRRYAGHQVQPKKTIALLKTRGWMASYEEGLQKVYYKENIIATIYAAADWFSPADIEAPTIEYVSFEDRKTFKQVPIDKIPRLIFSEVMRDVDLVVSVAHVGGVDPEASLSTLEIRAAIVEEVLKLLKLSNVFLKGSHAHITGVHGEYTVHLGSGVVHKMGRGSVNIIAVHSGHRGKIFLPFVDSDPRSAEILSKIILLAEDNKIKDPSIMEQICHGEGSFGDI